ANRAHFLVEPSSSLHAEALRHRDLHARDVVAIPDRLEKRSGKPEIEKILDRFLPQVMIDAEYGCLGKDAGERAVERLRRGEIAAEGLLDDTARVCAAPSLGQSVDNGCKHARRNGEIVQRSLSVAERVAQAF